MIDPELRAMLSHYGFAPETAWPIDENGVIHLLGDGTWRHPNDPEPIRGVRWVLENLGEALNISRQRTDHSGEWCEALVVSDSGGAQRRVYRSIGTPSGFDIRSNGFGDRNNQSDPGINNYIRAFPPNTWHDWITNEPYADHSNFSFNGWRPAGVPIWSLLTGRSHTNGPNQIWTPYNGMIFFSYNGNTDAYYVWVPFFCYTYDVITGGVIPKQVRWGYQVTAAWGANPPWSEQDVADWLMALPIENDGAWTIPTLASGESYRAVTQFWAGTRMLFRRHIVDTSGSTLYDGTLGGFLQVQQRTSTAPVVKQYEDGTEEEEGTIAVRELEFTTRGASSVYRAGEASVGDRLINPFVYAGFIWPVSTMLFIGSNGAWLNWTEYEGYPYPPLSLINSIPGSNFVQSWSLAAYLRITAQALYVGIGIYDPSLDVLSAGYFEDEYPLRGPGSDWYGDFDGEMRSQMDTPAGFTWNQNANAWISTAGGIVMRFTALIADDGDYHDPRYNTANGAVEAWLALGDGLTYEGPLGTVPRPRSGVTGTLLGQPVDGSTDFALDVVRTQADDLMAVMVTPDRVRAWTAAGVIWDDTHAASIPPPVLGTLDNTPPSLDLRFLHPAWPTPTGIVSVGGRSLIVTPRGREHRGYQWTTGGRVVSPPFTLHPGWAEADRYPYPDPRAPVRFEDDGGGGIPT